VKLSLDTKDDFDNYIRELLREQLSVNIYKDSRNYDDVIVIQVMLNGEVISEDYTYL
jgi:hypothetical protein